MRNRLARWLPLAALLAWSPLPVHAQTAPEQAPSQPGLQRHDWAQPVCGGAKTISRHLTSAPTIVQRCAQLVASTAERLWPPPPCPDEAMAHLGRYCIDRYEGHLVSQIDGKWVIHPHAQRPAPGVRYEARSAAGIFPQGYISRVEAAQACGNAGKRLCSWLEWRRACQGRYWHRYPYGPQGRRGHCNTGKDHLLRRFFGDKSWKYDEHFNSPRLNSEPGFLARSGKYTECRTPDRVYDMSGNLHEWVATGVDQDFVDRMEAEDVERVDQPWVTGNGMFLGGFYSTTDQHGPGCFYTTIAHEPRYHDYSTGFRCCATAQKPPPLSKTK